MALAAIIDLLRCPACPAQSYTGQRHTSPLRLDGEVARCERRHSFDVARAGYLNLAATAQPAHADTSSMVSARATFLAAGHYRAVVAAVDGLSGTAGTIVDVGAGPGHYAAQLLASRPDSRAVALDISVAACRRAARAHQRLGAVVADVWQRLPVADGAADVVLDVFAPRNVSEFRRVLGSRGRIVTVTPTAGHLRELHRPLGLIGMESDKHERLSEAMAAALLREIDRVEVAETQTWDRHTAALAATMGPSAFHIEPEQLARRLAAVGWPRRVTVACTVSAWADDDR